MPIAGKPIIEYLLDKIQLIEEVDTIYIVANEKFYPHYKLWYNRLKAAGVYDKEIKIINDHTKEDGTKLGAIGDIKFVIDIENIDDDLIVMGGDNLWEFNLRELIDYFNEKKQNIIALHDINDKEIVKRMSVAELNPENKIISFKEKPQDPKTTLIGICCYIYRKQTLPKITEYIEKGNNPDAPGFFIEWLHENDTVYGWVFSETWFDIGNIDQFEKANEQYGGI